MTKESYFNMCEELGTEPLESEIPTELEDLVEEAQDCVLIYSMLQDCWDYMNGNYIGKNFNYIQQVFKMYEIPEHLHKVYFELLQRLDNIRSKHIQDTKPKDK